MIFYSILIRLMQKLVLYNANDPENFNIIYFNRQDLKFLVVNFLGKALVKMVICSYLNPSLFIRVFGSGKRGR